MGITYIHLWWDDRSFTDQTRPAGPPTEATEQIEQTEQTEPTEPTDRQN